MGLGRYESDHDGFGGFQPMRACLEGRYKRVINLLSSDELYDRETDPYERINLISFPEPRTVRDALHDAVLEWMNATRDPFRGYVWERRPWRTDARPATGRSTGMARQRENEECEPRQLDYETGLPMTSAVRPKRAGWSSRGVSAASSLPLESVPAAALPIGGTDREDPFATLRRQFSARRNHDKIFVPLAEEQLSQ